MLAQTPPLGWNTWNTFAGDINADLIRETADAFVETGLKDAGYEYVVIDDLWQADERKDGKLTWDVDKFPDGIPALAEYVHGKGLKFGIYSCVGSYTCAGKPASYGYEEEDARTFAEWGVDFLKVDCCNVPAGAYPPAIYRRVGQALRNAGRPILYSICEWGHHQPWKWGASVGGHMWRTTGDIYDAWVSICEIGFKKQDGLESYAGPGRWNDPDMLVVGMCGKGAAGHEKGCTDAEYRSHFVLWCLLAAPLMIGCDVRNMNSATRELLMNRELLAVNQDALGRQAWRVGEVLHGGESAHVYAKALEDGSIAVGLFNVSDKDWRIISVPWESLGLQDRRRCEVIDLISGESLGIHDRAFAGHVNKHDVLAVRIVPQGN
jgi:alpha-galactosidase